MGMARYTEITLVYNGVDISRDAAPFLSAFSFTDNSEEKADDLQVTLQDSDGRWKEGWFPSKGDTLTAAIETVDGKTTGRLPCGIFEIDDVSASGPPSTVVLKGIPSLVANSLRREKKTKAWENISLSGIAGEMAGNAGVSLFFDVPGDPHYERRDQREQTDISFLRGLCDDAGFSVKISNGNLVVFDEGRYENASPVMTLTPDRVERYSFRSKAADVYKSCTVKYHNAGEKELLAYTYTPDPVPPVGQVLRVSRRVESIAEAERVAKKMLRKANRLEVTGSLDLAGEVRLSAGLNISVSGWGHFDGTYMIESAKHTVDSGGYKTSVQIRKALKY